jgi:hypothetical protein
VEVQPFTDVESIGVVGQELRSEVTEPAKHFFSGPVDICDLGQVDDHPGQSPVGTNEGLDLFAASFCHAARHPEGGCT